MRLDAREKADAKRWVECKIRSIDGDVDAPVFAEYAVELLGKDMGGGGGGAHRKHCAEQLEALLGDDRRAATRFVGDLFDAVESGSCADEADGSGRGGGRGGARAGGGGGGDDDDEEEEVDYEDYDEDNSGGGARGRGGGGRG